MSSPEPSTSTTTTTTTTAAALDSSIAAADAASMFGDELIDDLIEDYIRFFRLYAGGDDLVTFRLIIVDEYED